VTGRVLLAAGGAVTVLAYRLMMRIGRLPEERRVLR
jgi:tight adherence protein B